MNDSKLFALAQAGTQIAARGAAEYLKSHKLTADDGALAEALGRWTKTRFPEAMHDAKKAIDCGMTDAAVLTFGASMLQAGIEAAKEAATRPELFELLFTEPSTAELDAELARGDALQEIDNDDGGRL